MHTFSIVTLVVAEHGNGPHNSPNVYLKPMTDQPGVFPSVNTLNIIVS